MNSMDGNEMSESGIIRKGGGKMILFSASDTFMAKDKAVMRRPYSKR